MPLQLDQICEGTVMVMVFVVRKITITKKVARRSDILFLTFRTIMERFNEVQEIVGKDLVRSLNVKGLPPIIREC